MWSRSGPGWSTCSRNTAGRRLGEAEAFAQARPSFDFDLAEDGGAADVEAFRGGGLRVRVWDGFQAGFLFGDGAQDRVAVEQYDRVRRHADLHVGEDRLHVDLDVVVRVLRLGIVERDVAEDRVHFLPLRDEPVAHPL